MSLLVLSHVVTGLAGIAAGGIVIAGLLRRRSVSWLWDLLFLLNTFAACATGFVFLPTEGITSAQLVSFFLTALLAVAAFLRFRRGNAFHTGGSGRQVYALVVVGSVFLNVLITTSQSFVHLAPLKRLAPQQESPVFVAIKVLLLTTFIALAILAARKTGATAPSTRDRA